MAKRDDFDALKEKFDADAVESAKSADADFDSAELSEEEKLELQVQARREVLKEIKASKKKAFLEEEKRKQTATVMFANGKDDAGDDLDTVTLELASYPPYIVLDGRRYYSGKTYTKKKAVVAVLKDIMNQGWRAEAARLGEDTNNFMRRRMAVNRFGAHAA